MKIKFLKKYWKSILSVILLYLVIFCKISYPNVKLTDWVFYLGMITLLGALSTELYYNNILCITEEGDKIKIFSNKESEDELLFIVDEYKFSFYKGKFGIFWKKKNLNSTTEDKLEKFLEKEKINVDFHQYVGNEYSIDETINLK